MKKISFLIIKSLFRPMLVLMIIIISARMVKAQPNDYIFEKISSEAGITFNAISSIIEDKYGFMWFGSNHGLYNYNTSEIIRYNYDPKDENSLPSDRINNLYTDSTGRIWICTDKGLCYFNESRNAFNRIPMRDQGVFLDNTIVTHIIQYSSSEFLIVVNLNLYRFSTDDYELEEIQLDNPNEDIVYLGQINKDQICVGTAGGKVFISNGSQNEFHLLHDSSAGPISTIKQINKQYWIGFRFDGVHVVSNSGNLIQIYSPDESADFALPNNQVQEIIERKNGEVWIGSLGGITIINKNGIQTIKPNSYNGLPHFGIFELFHDNNDGVWVGTWSGGLAYYSDYNYKFPHIRHNNGDEYSASSVISCFEERSDGQILIGSENMGIGIYNPENRTIKELKTAQSEIPVRIKSLLKDKEERHWFGTFREGLWVLENNIFSRIGDFNGIFSSIHSSEDGIWIGDREGGVIYYDNSKKEIKKYISSTTSLGTLSSNQTWDLIVDSRGDLWVCSDNGLSVMRKNSENFVRYFRNERETSISRNRNFTITEDRYGKLWIGTGGAGIDIYDPESGIFSKFRLNEEISNADVYSILRDSDENIWFSTNQGIYKYDQNFNTLRHFTQNDGLLGNQYHPNSGFVSSKGIVYFGGGNGFNVIDPEAVKQNQFVPKAYLSKLLINNTPFNEQKLISVNSMYINSIERVELKYNQNSLTFSFVANSYIKKDKNIFKYRIRNYQEDWNDIPSGTDVSLAKIPHGDYVLEILASNNDGIWSQSPREIQITIRPPFWQAWYAFLLYSLLFIGSLYLIIKAQRYRAKTKADELLFSEKVKFFTNVSHEFRTPLSLILSPLDQLKRKVKSDPECTDQVNIIKRNADRLLRLTNQLLDFRLIELNKSKIKAAKTDMVSLCQNVYDCFEFQVLEKEINYIFNSEFKSFSLNVDQEKIDKIVYNLLSNAFKYSEDKGQIILSLEQKMLDIDSYANIYCSGEKFYGEALEILIKDNGKGIKPDAIPHIFDRFYVDHDENQLGSGIGLHICQEYVRLHNGNIMVSSELGQGAAFTVNLPLESSIESEKESIIIQSLFDPVPEDPALEPEENENMQIRKIILFAEDNDEMRIYTKKTLSKNYKTLTAKNGQQAFEIAREVIPDIIITDILMPGMDGLQLTEKIRETPETNHIPIILLTALSDDERKVESMTKGANAFLTKPVDESFLLAKIENILKERQNLQKRYEEQSKSPLMEPVRNESFIVKAEKIVEANLQNPAFEISEFASQLSISRSSLQRKMKSAINLNPSEFIRDYRLKKAVLLIKQGNLNIDEIAILVGFNSTSYFM